MNEFSNKLHMSTLKVLSETLINFLLYKMKVAYDIELFYLKESTSSFRGFTEILSIWAWRDIRDRGRNI